MPPYRQPAALHAAALASLERAIHFRIRVLLSCHGVDASSTLSFFQRAIWSLPSPLATRVAQNALRCADDLAERHALCTTGLEHIVRILIHENTAAFEVSPFYSYQVRRAVLKRICDLRFLRIYYNLEHHHENVHTLSTLRDLKSLSNLREIYLRQWFTDQMACLLGQSCPSLQVLDAQYSHCMTDASVQSLTRCQDLRVVVVSSTNLSDHGYCQLLEKLPRLQKIGYCERLNAIVEVIGGRLTPLSLREYQSAVAPTQSTFQMCPDLSTVIIHDPSTSTELPRNVDTLVIQNQKHVSSDLSKMLNSNITHLELVECGVSEDAVAAIAALCSDLRRLRLHSDSLHDNLRLRIKYQKSFQRLEWLDITDSNLALDILSVAQNIRSFISQPRKIKFDHDIPWTNATLTAILNRNPLQHLESFRVASTCTASADGIMNFIRACPKLRTIGNVQTWGFSFHHIGHTLKRENMAVELA